jgi:hypothetical protein
MYSIYIRTVAWVGTWAQFNDLISVRSSARIAVSLFCFEHHYFTIIVSLSVLAGH